MVNTILNRSCTLIVCCILYSEINRLTINYCCEVRSQTYTILKSTCDRQPSCCIVANCCNIDATSYRSLVLLLTNINNEAVTSRRNKSTIIVDCEDTETDLVTNLTLVDIYSKNTTFVSLYNLTKTCVLIVIPSVDSRCTTLRVYVVIITYYIEVLNLILISWEVNVNLLIVFCRNLSTTKITSSLLVLVQCNGMVITHCCLWPDLNILKTCCCSEVCRLLYGQIVCRGYITILSILFSCGILDSHCIENMIVLVCTSTTNLLLNLICSNASLNLYRNSPKTRSSRCTAQQCVETLWSTKLENVAQVTTLRVNQLDSCILCKLSVCWIYTYYDWSFIIERSTLLVCLLIASLCNYSTSVILLTLTESKISSNIVSHELQISLTVKNIIPFTAFICIKVIATNQANLSYHSCVLTDDVLQLVLDVSNLSSETEFSVIVLNTVQYALDSSQTWIECTELLVRCTNLTLDSLDCSSYSVLFAITLTENIESISDSLLVGISLCQSITSILYCFSQAFKSLLVTFFSIILQSLCDCLLCLLQILCILRLKSLDCLLSSISSIFKLSLCCQSLQSLNDVSICLLSISSSLVSSSLSFHYIFLQLSDVASLESINSILQCLVCIIDILLSCIVSQDSLNLVKSCLVCQLSLKRSDVRLVRRNQSLELCNLLWKLIGSSKLVDLTLQVTDVVIIILTRSKCTYGWKCQYTHKQRA